MANPSDKCTCRGSKTGTCHVRPRGTSDRDIAATVAEQSQPSVSIPGESRVAERSRNAADRRRRRRWAA